MSVPTGGRPNRSALLSPGGGVSPTGLGPPAGPPGPGCFPQHIPQSDRSLRGGGVSRTGTTVHALVAQDGELAGAPERG